jgi:hypothetical protein
MSTPSPQPVKAADRERYAALHARSRERQAIVRALFAGRPR